jgi:hypothetical protein
MPEVSELRPWEPERDEDARERSRARLAQRFGRRRRRPYAVAVILAVVAVGAGVALGSGFWRTQHTGHLPVFTPQGTLSPRFHVGHTARGYCWTSSSATGARDAYRCFEGNLIHDPCFAARHDAKVVACFLDPWHPVTLLRLTKPLPKPAPGATTLPWAIETADGRRCTFLTGATAPMGGLRINYGCTDHSYLVGTPNRSKPLWTILSAAKYVPEAPRSSLARVGIAKTVP